MVAPLLAFLSFFCPSATTGFFVATENIKKDVVGWKHNRRLLRSFPTDNENERSVSDYTLGLHGGKYQFGNAGGMSLEGQQFAEALYSSGQKEEETTDYWQEPLPGWAQRMRAAEQPPTRLTERVVVVAQSADSPPAVIEIVNEEMSWERFYVFVKNSRDSQDARVLVEPTAGMLSPRGGRAKLTIKNNPLYDASLASKEKHDWWILVGTEAETWTYRLVFED